jgi:2-methylisocitrate lyase-like PEP mutase family enzyme
MTQSTPVETVARRAEALRTLHVGPALLVLPNAWDAATAQVFERVGFPAIATTSGGVANALGYNDHEQAPLEEMLAAARRIISAVTVPVTVDFEAGYRLSPEEIAGRLIAVGAAGLNFEDSDHHGDAAVVEAEAQAERIGRIKAAARAAGVDLVLNARVDMFIHRLGTADEQLAEAVSRGRLYREAGADCIYPIILNDPEAITALVQACGVVNLTVRRGGPLSLGQAAALGARRVSYATSMFRETMSAVEAIANEVKALLPSASEPVLP